MQVQPASLQAGVCPPSTSAPLSSSPSKIGPPLDPPPLDPAPLDPAPLDPPPPLPPPNPEESVFEVAQDPTQRTDVARATLKARIHTCENADWTMQLE